jgi:hypothetical protein
MLKKTKNQQKKEKAQILMPDLNEFVLNVSGDDNG